MGKVKQASQSAFGKERLREDHRVEEQRQTTSGIDNGSQNGGAELQVQVAV
jgi:hypothetical protein